MKKLKLISWICTIGLCVTGVHQAYAAAQLRLSDGTVAGTVTITDNGPGDSSPATGVITYSGPVGASWALSVTIGQGYPVLGSPALPSLDLGTTSRSSGAASLTIEFTQDGYTTPGTADLQIGGTTVGGVQYSVYTDPNNTLFGETTLIGTLAPVPSGGAFSGQTSGTVTGPTPYSITLKTVISHPAAGNTGFDAQLTITPPACNCALTFNSPTQITNCAGDRIPDVTASQDCGNGSVSVPVTFVGAGTNGVCPKIITRTNTAVDNCGNLHTFVQTITVNCNPDCTITPSVTVATVGSNYTASVADAGTGATYAWTITNGKINSGQNTPTISWTAGTDTNNPVGIQIVVTAGTGCQSGCSDTVKLISPPPPGGFGSGDTATIGFWQNKNGQGLINNASNSPALANWLATTFPCLYGSSSSSNLTGKANSVIAARFVTLFKGSAPKTDAQIMCTALASYFTSTALGGGQGPVKNGFNQSPGGTGSKSFNVGSNGTDLGLTVNGTYTVLDILTAANNWRCSHPNTAWPTAVNDLFDSINQGGDIK